MVGLRQCGQKLCGQISFKFWILTGFIPRDKILYFKKNGITMYRRIFACLSTCIFHISSLSWSYVDNWTHRLKVFKIVIYALNSTSKKYAIKTIYYAHALFSYLNNWALWVWIFQNNNWKKYMNVKTKFYLVHSWKIHVQQYTCTWFERIHLFFAVLRNKLLPLFSELYKILSETAGSLNDIAQYYMI